MVYGDGFEEDFGGWAKDAHVPLDPNNPGHPVAWDVTRVTSPFHSGGYSLALYIDGRQDDGTVWIERPLAVKNNSQVHIEISFQLYSEAESFNLIASACAYAGTADPEIEEDFTVLGAANQVAGWKRYTYRPTIQAESTKIWVALGITVAWETAMTYNIDDVRVAIH
ncbi:MAG: hypothetical protein NWE81_01335 [Candidatus Bathyarchaeota archaeon]|nr:hypothetical protein [Candidatus Bathyarchaeota archaeon]